MKKTASSPEQDLHPDWDRFRGTMLYPLSCGEHLICNILRSYCKEQVCKDSVEEVFWPYNDFTTKTLLFDLGMFRFSKVPMHDPNSRV